MKYWGEFRDKFGFGDGDSVPPDAWARRFVYVLHVNRLAKEKGSGVRVYAYDRGGCHNPYLILRCTAATIVDADELAPCRGGLDFDESQPDADAEFEEALEDAFDADLDALVTTQVVIDGYPHEEEG